MEAAGLTEPFMKCVMERIAEHLNRRAKGRLRIECIVFLSEVGLLGRTEGAEALLDRIKENR